jgi:hypothetical protein
VAEPRLPESADVDIGGVLAAKEGKGGSEVEDFKSTALGGNGFSCPCCCMGVVVASVDLVLVNFDEKNDPIPAPQVDKLVAAAVAAVDAVVEALLTWSWNPVVGLLTVAVPDAGVDAAEEKNENDLNDVVD